MLSVQCWRRPVEAGPLSIQHQADGTDAALLRTGLLLHGGMHLGSCIASGPAVAGMTLVVHAIFRSVLVAQDALYTNSVLYLLAFFVQCYN